MTDEIITNTLDRPSSLLFQRIRAIGRVLGRGIAIESKMLSLSLDASASERSPGWFAGEVRQGASLAFLVPPSLLLRPSHWGILRCEVAA